MEPITMPAMAPPDRVLASLGLLLSFGWAVLVPVMMVMVLPSGLVWDWRGWRVRVGWRVVARVWRRVWADSPGG